MNENQEELDGKQNRLIEIYKLQSQLANNISNRRTTTNRFYLLVMSALTVIFSAFLQNIDKLPNEVVDVVSVEWIIVSFGVLGITLSWIWCLSINSYLRVNSRKYKALNKLEDELEYKFFKEESEFLGRIEKGTTYWQRSLIELTIPGIFFLLFVGFMWIGLRNLPQENFALFMFYPVFLLQFFFYKLTKWYKIEKKPIKPIPENLDKGECTNGKMDG